MKKSKRILLLISIALLIFSSWGEITLLKNRKETGLGKPENLKTLYLIKDSPTIQHFELKDNLLHITTLQSDIPSTTSIHLKEGFHKYPLNLKKSSAIPLAFQESISLSYTPKSTYEIASNSSSNQCQIIQSSIPIYNGKIYSLADWTDGYFSKDSKTSIKEAKQRLNHLHINDLPHTLKKIEVLTSFLVSELKSSFGTPSDKMEDLSGLETFEAALKKESSVWCSNLAKIYVAYANLANIPSRIVYSAGSISNLSLSGHAFCESYIPEQKKWALVDLSSQISYITNNDGIVQNSYEILNHFALNTINHLSAMHINDSSLNRVEQTPYKKVYSSHKNYFVKDAHLIYQFPGQESRKKIDQLFRYFFSPKKIYSANSLPLLYSYLARTSLLFIWGASFIVTAILCLSFLNFSKFKK